MIDPANREGRNKQRETETNFFLFAAGDGGSTLCVPVERKKKKK